MKTPERKDVSHSQTIQHGSADSPKQKRPVWTPTRIFNSQLRDIIKERGLVGNSSPNSATIHMVEDCEESRDSEHEDQNSLTCSPTNADQSRKPICIDYVDVQKSSESPHDLASIPLPTSPYSPQVQLGQQTPPVNKRINIFPVSSVTFSDSLLCSSPDPLLVKWPKIKGASNQQVDEDVAFNGKSHKRRRPEKSNSSRTPGKSEDHRSRARRESWRECARSVDRSKALSCDAERQGQRSKNPEERDCGKKSKRRKSPRKEDNHREKQVSMACDANHNSSVTTVKTEPQNHDLKLELVDTKQEEVNCKGTSKIKSSTQRIFPEFSPTSLSVSPHSSILKKEECSKPDRESLDASTELITSGESSDEEGPAFESSFSSQGSAKSSLLLSTSHGGSSSELGKTQTYRSTEYVDSSGISSDQPLDSDQDPDAWRGQMQPFSFYSNTPPPRPYTPIQWSAYPIRPSGFHLLPYPARDIHTQPVLSSPVLSYERADRQPDKRFQRLQALHDPPKPNFNGYQLIGDSILLRFSQQLLGESAIQAEGIRFLGFCVSGQRIGELLKRLKHDFYHIGKKVVVLIGTNDLIKNTNIDQMLTELFKVVTLLRKKAEEVVLLTLPPIPLLEDRSSHWIRLDKYNNYIKALASKDSGISVSDVFPLYVRSQEEMEEEILEQFNMMTLICHGCYACSEEAETDLESEYDNDAGFDGDADLDSAGIIPTYSNSYTQVNVQDICAMFADKRIRKSRIDCYEKFFKDSNRKDMIHLNNKGLQVVREHLRRSLF